MMDANKICVYFSCPSCEAIYSATQERKPSKYIGRFVCEGCKTTVHKWWSTQYSFTDWQGPLYKPRVTAH
jgi:hypothetical protein